MSAIKFIADVEWDISWGTERLEYIVVNNIVGLIVVTVVSDLETNVVPPPVLLVSKLL